jgi:heat shock protein HslJ
MRRYTFLDALIALTALPLLFACHQGSQSESIPITASELGLVCEQEWLLHSIEQDGKQLTLVPDSTVTFQCTPEGRVAGMASVNRYFGGFKLDQTGRIEWAANGFGSTLMAGPEPLMTQEQLYLRSLPKARKMQLQGDALLLGTGDNSLVMRFTRAPSGNAGEVLQSE